MLAGLVAAERPEAVVSFAPPLHVYGALATCLMPAHLQLPVWYRSSFFGAMPAVPRRVVVVATPWILTLLLQHMDWIREMDHVTVLLGGAMLPASAGEFLREAGSERALIVELMGSTEAGGVATRRWRHGEPPPWTLFADVAAEDRRPAEPGTEVQLAVRSPRLACRPDEAPPAVWEADDRVEWLDERTFRLAGRVGQLVKVNGRRINLDEAEHAMRAVLDCADLALVPIIDPMIGEHVELLIVLKPGTHLPDIDLPAAFMRLGVRPKRVRAVPRIDRSALGKLRHGRLRHPDNAEVATT